MDEEGYVSLPEGPGLGVTVDEAKVIEVGQDGRRFTWPDSRLADGSIADY
jgi:galactonate dehydratase